jgi:hypothetical protein
MRTLLLILFFYLASCGDAPRNSKQLGVADLSKKTEDWNTEDSLFTIVRVDQRNQRVFVAVDSTVLTNVGKLRRFIENLGERYKFRDDLNVTFVQHAKYAGYKDELHATRGISYDTFYSHYLGEYNRNTKVFWLYPSLADKKVKFIFN